MPERSSTFTSLSGAPPLSVSCPFHRENKTSIDKNVVVCMQTSSPLLPTSHLLFDPAAEICPRLLLNRRPHNVSLTKSNTTGRLSDRQVIFPRPAARNWSPSALVKSCQLPTRGLFLGSGPPATWEEPRSSIFPYRVGNTRQVKTAYRRAHPRLSQAAIYQRLKGSWGQITI
jgi:hypothetical protein